MPSGDIKFGYVTRRTGLKNHYCVTLIWLSRGKQDRRTDNIILSKRQVNSQLLHRFQKILSLDHFILYKNFFHITLMSGSRVSQRTTFFLENTPYRLSQ